MKRALVLLVVAGACGPGNPPPPPPPSQCELTLGSAPTGGTGFAEMPLAATLVPGAQGGFHVWLSYRIKGAGEAGVLKAAHTVRREADGKLFSRGERRLELSAPGADGWWESDLATPAFLCPTPIGVSVIGEQAIFEVTLFAEDGTEMAKQQVRSQLTCPTGGQAEFCQRICTG